MRVEDLFLALDYIEEHIKGELFIQDIADFCYVSLSSLQKTFKYAFHMSINDYIIKRRFSCAAKDILSTDKTLLEIALEYGYANAESFTRGFKKVWNITPSEFRRTRKFAGHTPKLAVVNSNQMEDTVMRGTKYDLTQLYEVLQNRKNNAYVCADLNRLMWINDTYGMAAGDAALVELMRRVEAACDEEDVFLRIGGDEFVVMTNSEDMTHANDIVRQVSSQNGQTITFEGNEFPVAVRIGAFISRYERSVSAAQMFDQIREDISIIQAE